MIGEVASAIGALGSLFGKKKQPNAADNIDLQALGARRAAEKYGFNPLTLLQYGQPGGSLATASDVPPLASIEFIADAISGIEKEINGDAERQRQADQLNLELARLKLEQARSGVVVGPPSAAQSAGQGPSPLGRTAVTVIPETANSGVPRATASLDRGSLSWPQTRPDNSGYPSPLTMPGVLADGTVVTVPNPNNNADFEQWLGYGMAEAKRSYDELPDRRENLKQRGRNYGYRWLRDVFGKDEKRRKDAQRSAYGPQQAPWSF